MFDFHYNYIKKKYSADEPHHQQGVAGQAFPRAELMFTDTDSLLYHVHTNDFYNDISKDI